MNKYQGVSIPKELLQLIDLKGKNHGYTSRADFIRHAIREKLDRMGEMII